MPDNIKISVLTSQETNEQLVAELADILRLRSELEAIALPARQAHPGDARTKGPLLEAGNLLVTLLTSGAAIALVECLRTYVKRRRSIQLEVTTTRGTLRISAENHDLEKLLPLVEAGSEPLAQAASLSSETPQSPYVLPAAAAGQRASALPPPEPDRIPDQLPPETAATEPAKGSS